MKFFYEQMTQYIVRDDRGEYIMTAPLRTITRVFNFGDSAERRIKIEGEHEEGAKMFFNNRRHGITGQSEYVTIHTVQGQH